MSKCIVTLADNIVVSVSLVGDDAVLKEGDLEIPDYRTDLLLSTYNDGEFIDSEGNVIYSI